MIRAALLLFSLPLAAQPGSSILARGFHSEFLIPAFCPLPSAFCIL